MKWWIAHPAADGAPVPFLRWLNFQVGILLCAIGSRIKAKGDRMEFKAVYGHDLDEEIPF